MSNLEKYNKAFMDTFEITEDQLIVDDINIPQRIYGAVDVDDILVLKAADYMDNGVHFPNVGQEFVSEAFARSRSFDQSGDIDELDDSRCIFLRMIKIRQPVEAFIRHRDGAHVRFDGTERIVGGSCSRTGNSVEQRALSHIGEADDTQFHIYAFPLIKL